jgi:hypothetical protein
MPCLGLHSNADVDAPAQQTPKYTSSPAKPAGQGETIPRRATTALIFSDGRSSRRHHASTRLGTRPIVLENVSRGFSTNK